MKASCGHIFFEFGNQRWRKLDGDCRGEVREYKVEPDEGEVRATRAAYGKKRAFGFYKSLCDAHLTDLCRAYPEWKITEEIRPEIRERTKS